MNFYIKQNSTYPILKFPLTEMLMKKYNITDDMMDDFALTFSMYGIDSGIYKIANVPANVEIVNEREDYLDVVKYYLTYEFNLFDTKDVGVYNGEFKLDFMGRYCHKLTIPNNDYIKIFITNSLTKTTVI